MNRLLRTLILLAIAGVLAGCQSPKPAFTQSALPSPEKILARNNCASLLYDLLGDEKNVSKLLVIKRDRDELHRLIKSISSAAADAAKQLDELAQQDSSLNLHATGLPAGEKLTRDALSKITAGELLRASGPDFELKLLLTQAEALSYGSSLAKVAAENSAQTNQFLEFANISAKMRSLHEQVLGLMRSPPPAKLKN